LVAGSSPVSRSPKILKADVAQLVEHILGKDEVTGSIPVVSSNVFENADVAKLIEHLFGKDVSPACLPVGKFNPGRQLKCFLKC
jgi:hypothetical protein